MPLNETECCDGIFYRGRPTVNSIRLDSPPEVFFDPTKSESDNASREDNSVARRRGTYRSRSARLYGSPAECRSAVAVSILPTRITGHVSRSFSRLCHVRIVLEKENEVRETNMSGVYAFGRSERGAQCVLHPLCESSHDPIPQLRAFIQLERV